jgi:cell wall-associated NlpC family hydrolase
MKLLIIILTVATLNFGSVKAQSEIVEPKPVTVVHDLKALALKHAQEKKLQQKRIQLKKVVSYVKTRVHKTAYVFSGSTIAGWDCSGLVRYTYKRLGITLEHSANKQAHSGKRVSKPKVGDVVVFAYQGRTDFYHSAIYIGNGLIVNANQMYKTTVIQPLTDFSKSQIRFVRIIK